MELSVEELDRLNANPMYRTLGISITEMRTGFAQSRMAAPGSVRWPAPDQPHGGIVFLQLDTTMATAVMSKIGKEQATSTISVEVQYLRAAKGEFLTCTAAETHTTRRMCFVRAETRSPEGELVALAQGSFRIFSENHGIDALS